MPGKRLQEDSQQTSVRLPTALYNAIAELAEDSDRTMADQIRFMLKKYLEITQNK